MAQQVGRQQNARVALCQAIRDLRRGIAQHGGARANQVSFGRVLTDPDYRAKVIARVRESESAELRALADSPVSRDAAGRSELDLEGIGREPGPRRGVRGPLALAGTAAVVLLFAVAGGILSYFFSSPLAAMLAGEQVVSGAITSSEARASASIRRCPGTCSTSSTPDYMPAADSPATEGALALPQGEFRDPSAASIGAVDPRTARSWVVGWTAFPDHGSAKRERCRPVRPRALSALPTGAVGACGGRRAMREAWRRRRMEQGRAHPDRRGPGSRAAGRTRGHETLRGRRQRGRSTADRPR